MPALSVSVDGVALATVSTDGYDVVSVRAGGTQVDDDPATLQLDGGSYPKHGEASYLTWISDAPLQTGQVVTVSFLETASSSHAGKTIEELFPDEPLSKQNDLKPTSDVFAELRAMPTLRDKFAFRLVSSSGTNFAGETARDEHGFGFTVLWNSFHPERVRASLHSYTLNSLEARGPMNNHVEEKLQYGGWVRFELVP
jgi:hypothetical protein